MATNNGTISKNTFECFVCKKQGFTERVYLAGKDSNGKTIYIAEDGVTAHQHKFNERVTNPTTLSTSADTILSELAKINAKLDRLLTVEGHDPVE